MINPIERITQHRIVQLFKEKQRFARENIRIPSSTIEGWTKEALIKLHPLYEQLIFDTKAKGYLQVDETVCLEAA